MYQNINNTHEIIEEVIELEIASGNSLGFVEPTTDSDGSKVIQTVVYYQGTATESINAGIQVAGKDVSKMQHIDNYRSRDAAYLQNKPCYFESGKRVRFEVRTAGTFSTDFKAQLILIKAKPIC